MASVAGVVLAAGRGRRLGSPKAGITIDGVPLVERSARALAAGGCDHVVVVLGALQLAVPSATLVVDNPAWAAGIGTSLRAGMAAADGLDATQLLVVLCDQPGIGSPVVEHVLASTGRGPEVVGMATFDGVRSHPVLIGADHWQGVAVYAVADVGARGYLAKHPDLVTEVACDGLGDPADVDHPTDLAAWLG